MTLSAVIIIGLSVYATAYMLRYTDGPFDIFSRLREWLGVHELPIYEDGTEVYIGMGEYVDDRFVSRLVACFWCLSTWVALIHMFMWYVFPYYVYLTAIIGVSGLIYEAVHGKSDE